MTKTAGGARGDSTTLTTETVACHGWRLMRAGHCTYFHVFDVVKKITLTQSNKEKKRGKT